MPKKNPNKIEVIDLGNGDCIIQKGETKIEVPITDIQLLLIELGNHFNKYDKLPF